MFQRKFRRIFYNPEYAFRSWGAFTVTLIALYPFYFIPLIYLSFIAPTSSAASLFRIVILLGLILTPTIIFIGSKLGSVKNWLTAWVFLIILGIMTGSIPYAYHQRSTREEFSLSNIPPYPGSNFQDIKYSPGNAWASEPSTTITFNLDGADDKFTDIVDFYNKELIKNGWVDDRSEDQYQNEAYWESQPWYTPVTEDWFLLIGPRNVNYFSASVSKSSLKNKSYSVSVGFYACNDILCRIEDWLFRPTVFMINQFKKL